jgi:2-aminoethylphosphonate-pyruvate transaminase
VIETAVILAAGMGTRLGGELKDAPKGFLRLGVQPIIEESISCLIDAGIRDFVIVPGHGATHYEQLAAKQDRIVRTVHNPAFADSGSMYSLYCARDAIAGGFLLLESDLIYEARAVTTLLSDPAEDAVLLSGPTHAGDEVYVWTDQPDDPRHGKLLDMSKDRQALGGRVSGELVGISKISAALFAIMQRIAAAAFQKSLHFDYETDCLVAAARQHRIACPLISDLRWAEIDDPDHLKRAREQIYPEIQRLALASTS